MDPESLLRHRDFLEALARGLLDDDAEAEDVVQETYVAALERPPEGARSLRAWLARVARNRAVDFVRRRARRRTREARAARRDSSPDPSELAERLHGHRRAVEALLALDPPHRDVLLLRFYEDLPPREIARRLGIPVDTVRTRQRRALERMRASLGGSRGSGALLLLPVSPMKKTVALLALLLMTVTLVGVRVYRGERGEGGAGEGGATRALPGPREGAGPTAAARDGDACVTGILVSEIPAECAERGGVRARVRDGERLLREERIPAGAFALRYPRGGGAHALHLSGERLVAREFALPDGRTDLGEIRLARSVSFGGSVRDLDGRPLEGVTITASQEGIRTDGEPTGPDGRFRIELEGSASLAAEQEGVLWKMLLYARRDGAWGGPYYATRRGFDLNEALVIRLGDYPRFEVLLGPGRAPLEGATILLRQPPGWLGTASGPLCATATTDARGSARLAWPPWVEEGYLELLSPQGERTLLMTTRTDAFGSDPYVVALDEGSTVRLRLRVEDRRPVAGLRVRVDGAWSPYGAGAAGASEVSLLATVPESGDIEWRFVAERQPDGVFIPTRWLCEVPRGSTTQQVSREYEFESAPRVPAGGALDPIRLGEGEGERGDLLSVRFSSPSRTPPLCCFLYPDGEGTTMVAEGAADRWRVFVRHLREEWATHADLELLFALSGPRVGRLRLTTKELLRVVAAGEEISVDVAAQPSVAHVLLLDPDGAPVPAAFVQAAPLGPLAHALSSSTVTDSEGRSTFPYDPNAGTWRVVAVDRRTQAGALIPEWFDGGRERTIRLERPRAVSFRLAVEGEPRVKVWAQIMSPSFEIAPFHALIPDGDGRFRTPAVAPSLYRLHVYATPGGQLTPGGIPLSGIDEGGTVTVR